MQKITTFLTYNNQAEEAMNHYVSIFKNAKVKGIVRTPPNGPVLTCSFELEGQEFVALNGGSEFTFSMGTSLFVNCDSQEEIDHYWEKLSEGGETSQCGWLKDKFGMWWQVAPQILLDHLRDKNRSKAENVMKAMLKMTKIVIPELEEAYAEG